MRKEILEALKAKFAGVSDTILGRTADKLAKTVTSADQVAEAVNAVTVQSLLESYADFRATEAAKTAVTNYESKYGLKDGKSVKNDGGTPKPNQDEPEPKPKNDGGNDVPAWAKTLIESNEKLAKRMDSFDRDRQTTDRRKRLTDVIAKLPENLRKGYERTGLGGTDDEFQKTLTDIQTEVDAIVKENQQHGAAFGVPAYKAGDGGSNPKEATADEAKALADAMQI